MLLEGSAVGSGAMGSVWMWLVILLVVIGIGAAIFFIVRSQI